VKTVRLLILSVLLAVPPAFADFTEGSQELWLKAGVAVPSKGLEVEPGGRDAKIGGPGLSLGGEYFFHVIPQLALGLDVSYFKLGEKTSGTFVSNTDTAANAKTTMLLGMAKYSYATNGSVFFPYISGGLGLHVSTLKLEGSPTGGATWLDTGTAERRELMNDTRSSVALALGLGTDVSMSPRTLIGLEARYTYLGSVDYSPTRSGRISGLSKVSGGEHIIHLLAKAGLQF
jgi:opacity protein-like surface antigen